MSDACAMCARITHEETKDNLTETKNVRARVVTVSRLLGELLGERTYKLPRKKNGTTILLLEAQVYLLF